MVQGHRINELRLGWAERLWAILKDVWHKWVWVLGHWLWLMSETHREGVGRAVSPEVALQGHGSQLKREWVGTARKRKAPATCRGREVGREKLCLSSGKRRQSIPGLLPCWLLFASTRDSDQPSDSFLMEREFWGAGPSGAPALQILPPRVCGSQFGSDHCKILSNMYYSQICTTQIHV